MKKVIVIGGGLAGIATAVYLSDSGKFQTEILEASPKPGGRAYSFPDNFSNDVIDNGQHIMMGCYTDTLEFLGLIGSLDRIFIQPELSVNFADKKKGITPLSARSDIYPFNLIIGLLDFKAISWKERFGILSLLTQLPFINEDFLSSFSVLQWLRMRKQSEWTIKAFWEILAVGALNSDISLASAQIFVRILKQMFLKGNKAAAIILPKTGLSQMYCEGASEFISAHNGCIHLKEPVRSVEISNFRAVKIITKEREITDFDYLVSAVPAYALKRILPEEYHSQLPLKQIKYSSILSVHIWLKKNPFSKKFYGLINSPLHWVFNHDRHITIVISNADSLIEKPKEELFQLITGELKSYFSFFNENDILSYKIIKEKRATFIPENNFLNQRPHAETTVSNLFLAGDWTDTGLPATIEGAVKSGKTAAKMILSRTSF